ncbi:MULTISPECIES: hypothetical protein [unclassified Sutcliffiella]|uniref:hypothetical protein n=1 Tax=unclassified Sutcliffiella TaxID=2837532 RepID=UPI0030D5B2D7
MQILEATLIYNHQVPCTDGTFTNSYDVQVTIKLNEETLHLFYSLMEGETVWFHTFAYDQSGYERPGLLSPNDFRMLFASPEVSQHTNKAERKLGINERCELTMFPEEVFNSFDFVSFHDLCKRVAGVFHVKPHVLTFDDLGMCSYHAVKLEMEGGPIYILCNDYQFAFTQELEGYPIKFLHHKELASYFPPPYTAFTVEELNSPFCLDKINPVLAKREAYNINYWKPQTMGDFWFNYWD